MTPPTPPRLDEPFDVFVRRVCPEHAHLILQRDRQLRLLVVEAYEGEPPTNAWRRKAEDLDAWPGADEGHAEDFGA